MFCAKVVFFELASTKFSSNLKFIHPESISYSPAKNPWPGRIDGVALQQKYKSTEVQLKNQLVMNTLFAVSSVVFAAVAGISFIVVAFCVAIKKPNEIKQN